MVVDLTSLPRVTSAVTLKALKDECKVRGIRSTSKYNKLQLLELLVDNTILLSQTQAYKDVEAIKAAMKAELEAKTLAAEEIAQARREEAQVKEARREAAKRKRREVEREEEIQAQRKLHTIKAPKLHSCPLAKTNCLIMNGHPRSSTCDAQEHSCQFYPSYTCDSCNKDWCSFWYTFLQMSVKEQENARKKHAEKIRKEELQRQKRQREENARIEMEYRRQEEQRERKMQQVTNVSQSIKNPPPKSKNRNKMLKYVVWSSDGYENDGWHSYEGPPTKEFDSSYSKKEDAIARTRYLFFAKNVWGLDLDEMFGQEIETTNTAGGLLQLSVAPPDSSRWTVACIPKEAFDYLGDVEGRHSVRSSYDEPLASFF